MNMQSISVDHLVIGAGTAGCVVAGGLAARKDRSVLVLETGIGDGSLRTLVPAATKWMYARPEYDWQHPTEADPTLQGRADRWAAGHVTGGSSTINGTVYVRGSVEDYDAWAAAGNPGWAYADLLPLFRDLESSPIGSDEWRGRKGPLAVELTRSRHALTQAAAAAMRAAGLPWTEDMNGEHFEGAGWAQVTQRKGVRVNASRAFLHPALREGQHPVRLLTGALCLGLTIEDGRCTGAVFTHRGQTCKVTARHGVVLSAGAVKSPQLLMLSGIGPEQALQDLGITVHADVPGVGQGLMDHPVVKLCAYARGSTYNVETGPISGMGHVLNYLVNRRGLLAAPHAQLVAHVRSTPQAALPDMQIAFYPYAFERAEEGVRRARQPAMMFTVMVSQGRGHGEIALASADPLARPIVRHALLADAAERQVLIDGCKLVHRIASQAPLAAEIKSWMGIDPGTATDEDWQRFLAESASVAHHPAGTCRMGSDAAAVVDPSLRVRGIKGLTVADNSVMPGPVTGNTQAAAYIIGAKAAALLQAD